MKQAKAFFVTFFITTSLMVCGFTALYWITAYSAPQSAAENKTSVPLLTPDYNDTKTALIVVEADSTPFFFLLKLNALQKKVSLVSIPSSFPLAASQRTMAESMSYAGIMQCVQDISEEFDISVDYHLLCDKTALERIVSSFGSLNIKNIDGIPASVKNYLLKGSDYIDTAALVNAVYMSAAVLDNAVGLEFLNLAAMALIKANMQNICDYALGDLTENSSYLTTNINTREADRLRRIITFLLSADVQFDRLVLCDAATAQQEIDRILKE
ncbi:MAG: hypothetical protein IKT63_05750 [Oscillospiraceae bacterium]|nr:hypothetical protein [Oscillospiraceae bacterium]